VRLRLCAIACAALVASVPRSGAAGDEVPTLRSPTRDEGALGGHYRVSYASEAAGDFAAALAAIESVVLEDPTDYVAHLRRGWLAWRAGRHGVARLAYAEARRLRPSAVEPLLGAMLPAMAERRWREAEQLANEALARAPCDLTALTRLAAIHATQGRWARAEAHYRMVLRLFPSDVEVTLGLAHALAQQGRAEEAAALRAVVHRIAPDDPRARP
jgi:tetratricopeptide (TPR) repeat protein